MPTGNRAEQLLAALRGAASVAHSSSGEGDVRMLPLPEFKGEATHYQSWWNVVEATLDLYGLLDVVEKGVAGQEKCESVIGAQADEVVEVPQPSGASAGGASSSSVLTGAVNERKAKKAFVLILSAIKSVEVLGLLADVPRGNAFQLRRRLKEYYTRSNEVSKHQLLGEFYRLSQRGDESVALFSARVKAVVLTLKSIGESVSASAMQHAFISGLHGNYQHLRASLSLMGGKMSFEETVAAALMQEAQAEKDRGRRVRSWRPPRTARRASLLGDDCPFGGGAREVLLLVSPTTAGGGFEQRDVNVVPGQGRRNTVRRRWSWKRRWGRSRRWS